MRAIHLFAPLAALAISVAGCDVSGVVEDINDQAIQAAFDTIKGTAEQNGGAAMMLKPGAEVTLTVNNPASPLNGATVVVPSGAIPSDVENAVVAIQGSGFNGGQIGENPIMAGPDALVILRKLPMLEDIVPAVPLKLSLPYYAGATTYPAAEVVLGAVNYTAGTEGVTVVEGSAAVEAKKQVSGGIADLKLPFAAVWPVTFAGGAAPENALIYSVAKADGSTCAGFVADPEDYSPLLMLGNSYLELSVIVGNANTATLKSTISNPLPVPVAATTFALDTTTTSFQCNGETFDTAGATAINKLEAVFVDWVETQAVPSAQTCNMWSSTYCYTHQGQVTFTAELDYTTAAGDHVLVSAHKRFAGMGWINTTNNP